MATNLPSGLEPANLGGSSRLPAGTAALLVLGAMIAAAFGGLLGGAAPDRMHTANRTATLEVELPGTLRSGMFFETMIEVSAHDRLDDATVAMTPSLWRRITVNTQMPQPSEEEYSGGFFRLHYGPLDAGEKLIVKLDAQINPDLFAGTSGEVALFDGDRLIARVPIELTVLP